MFFMVYMVWRFGYNLYGILFCIMILEDDIVMIFSILVFIIFLYNYNYNYVLLLRNNYNYNYNWDSFLNLLFVNNFLYNLI